MACAGREKGQRQCCPGANNGSTGTKIEKGFEYERDLSASTVHSHMLVSLSGGRLR